MVAKTDHICVCICTYKRPKLLERLLIALQNQKMDGLFTYSIIVVDNDYKMSSKSIVTRLKKESLIDIDYYIEPEQNYALVRNKAVEKANGNFIAFIDDDELPINDWLFNLYKISNECEADGVLGPVKPCFEKEPPQWIIKSRVCERPSYKTGTILNWTNTRTGNVLLTKNIFNNAENYFNPDFGRTGGEDVDFFKRMIENGQKFIWCDEAPVYETVLPERFNRAYYLRRALLRGRTTYLRSSSFTVKVANIVKSIIAFSIYTLALPVLFLIGHHIFMRYLIKNCDHIGLLLSVCGLNIIEEKNF